MLFSLTPSHVSVQPGCLQDQLSIKITIKMDKGALVLRLPKKTEGGTVLLGMLLWISGATLPHKQLQCLAQKAKYL